MRKPKILPSVCLVALLVCVSCGNGAGKKDAAKAELTSPDLAYWELQGPVKTLTCLATATEKIQFDTRGKMTEMAGYDPFALDSPSRETDAEGNIVDRSQWQRDEQGRICAIIGYTSVTEYTWRDGKVAHEARFEEGWGWSTDYEYDTLGNLSKLKVYDVCEEEDTNQLTLSYIIEYEYIEFDAHGNWTRRKAKTADAIINRVDETEEQRTITYYEPSEL